ncbi:MAG TPA: alpha-amylase family protein, partial [Solirubrobacteraceae bacterium]|nr:alpha-amylase family protein [Solirubrobacteraceae bacterium]
MSSPSVHRTSTDVWWRGAVVYCLDVKVFADSNGDGIGDFAGLTQRLDYLDSLGVTCIWLMPFFPSPRRDDGYDIANHYGVGEGQGSLGDFVEFSRTAQARGIRLILDLVPNHTSDEHPWFQEASSDRDSPFHDFYVWCDERPEEPGKVLMPGLEESSWKYAEGVDRWYLHRFRHFQPDLNPFNEQVRDELAKIMGFWLQLGASGFRVDAVPYFLEAVRPDHDDVHGLMRDLRAFTARRRGDSALMGEVNLPPPEQRPFFGDSGDELQLILNFSVNRAHYLAMARRDARPIAEALAALPDIPQDCAWANFLRNHDELNLSHIPESEQDEIFAAFAPDEDMRLYGRGIRRRLPTMLGGDERRLRCAYSLMLALPGTPILLWGEEIGMGDNPELPDRLAVRTPMQWSDEPNGGFSSAAADELIRPTHPDGPFGYRERNVARQRTQQDSMLNWMSRAVHVRRDCGEISFGDWEILDTGVDAVLGLRYVWGGRETITLHNLGPEPAEVRLDLSGAESVVNLLADRDYDT